MIGVMMIATGGHKYAQFIAPLVESLHKFFPPHEAILITDQKDICPKEIHIHQEHLGWPLATLMRYRIFLENEKLLSRYDYLFYIDVDMLAMSPIEESEICGNGITAVLHPGYVTVPIKAYERNPKSTACIQGNKEYYQGCFQGGSRDAFFDMCRVLRDNIDKDEQNGFRAQWHDEAHLNRYLFDHPPVIALDPIFAAPSNPQAYPSVLGRQPKMIHICKGWEYLRG